MTKDEFLLKILILSEDELKVFYKKMFNFLINELEPRSRKLNMSIQEFLDPTVSYMMMVFETKKILTRSQIRNILDNTVDMHKQEHIS